MKTRGFRNVDNLICQADDELSNLESPIRMEFLTEASDDPADFFSERQERSVMT